MELRVGKFSVESVNPELASDQSYSGVIVKRTVASNALGFGAILNYNASGELVEAYGDIAAVRPGLFVALEAGTGLRDVLVWGTSAYVRNDSWSLTPGEPLYISSDTAGDLSYVGTAGKEIGYVESATTIYFGPVYQNFEDYVITFTHTGSTFEAIIDVDVGATILWTFSDATTDDTNHPSKDFGTSATRDTTLMVTPWSALKELNLGYDAGDDGPGTIDLLAPQNITDISGLNVVSPYLEILALTGNLITDLDIRGFSALQDVESLSCASLDTVQLQENTSILRLALEGSSVGTLDLSGCSALRDVRAGSNGMTNVNFGSLGPNFDHVCINQNPALNQLPSVDRFTSLNEFLMFESNQSGSLVFNSTDLGNISIEDNAYTELDISSCGFVTYINAANNSLATVDISSNPLLLYVYMQNNSLSETQVDGILSVLDAYGTNNGEVNLVGNAVPSVAGFASVSSLEGRGWTVNVESSNPYVTIYSPDDDETGVAVDTSFSITFNENVFAQTGTIDLYDSLDALVQSFDVTSDISGSGTSVITFTPTSSLTIDTSYYIHIDSGAFEDIDSNPYAGISDNTTWNFTTAASAAVWEDTFDRPDTTVLDNNWAGHGADGQITSNALLSDAGGYGILYNEIGGALPANHEVIWTIPHSRLSDNFWGIATHINTSTFDGCGFFFLTDPNDPLICNTAEAGGAPTSTITVTGGFPASWSVDQDHTVALRVVGTSWQIILDGQEYGTFTRTQSGTAIGVIGEGGKNWLNVAVYTAS